eukprot:TRINITY_DN20213_c0_g1_i1.p1 TRINITY_DN20213_c0_g1~~TRINITY_DN20213_c0_g1_i1.p1  ORF type:complete len:383 (+),score=39.50 TRINITY_DN20213_c0_g1_i1:103-1251(+)
MGSTPSLLLAAMRTGRYHNYTHFNTWLLAESGCVCLFPQSCAFGCHVEHPDAGPGIMFVPPQCAPEVAASQRQAQCRWCSVRPLPPPPQPSPPPPPPVSSAGHWKTTKVIVVANPAAQSAGVTYPPWSDGRDLSVWQYQTRAPDQPYHVQNNGHALEFAFYLRFIIDFYDRLPDITIFVHPDAFRHNPLWLHWLDCLRRDVKFVPNVPWLRTHIPNTTPQNSEGTRIGHAELFQIFGRPYPTSSQEPLVGYAPGAQWVFSRDTIRRYPREMYQRALDASLGGRIEARAFEFHMPVLFGRPMLDIKYDACESYRCDCPDCQVVKAGYKEGTVYNDGVHFYDPIPKLVPQWDHFRRGWEYFDQHCNRAELCWVNVLQGLDRVKC